MATGREARRTYTRGSWGLPRGDAVIFASQFHTLLPGPTLLGALGQAGDRRENLSVSYCDDRTWVFTI